MGREALDLGVLADNGLRRGRTTGACATAAVKAAMIMLARDEQVAEVDISLPDPRYYLTVPILRVQRLADGGVRADVRKEAGDDPDNTDGAVIFAVVRPNDTGEIRFRAGEGVGTVTEPGMRVPVGEPAINPVPRQMMRQAIVEVCGQTSNLGFDAEVGCVNGAAIAQKTFNPRLGIVGGISIIGTTGIVEPMSLAAYMASIEVYIRVAVADAPTVAYLPGKIGSQFVKQTLSLPPKRIVQISNYIGFALETTQGVLVELGRRLSILWLVGHPGKIAKVLDDVWDTHSSKSAMAMPTVARVAADCGVDAPTVARLAGANTVEAAMEQLKPHPRARDVWGEIERRVSARMQPRVPNVDRVEVRLFGLQGVALGQAA